MKQIVDLKQFERQGYAVLRKFFSGSEMEAIRPAFAETIARRPRPEALNARNMYFYSRIHRDDHRLAEFISQQRIVELLRPFTGPDIWVRWDQCVHKAHGSEVFSWHQDAAYTSLSEPYYLLWIALTPVTPERGALQLAPGSHRSGLLPHKTVGHRFVYGGPIQEAITIEAEVGDAVLFSSFTMHSTLPNISGEDRWTYVIEYVPLRVVEERNPPPYFVAALKGKPVARFVDSLPKGGGS